MDSPILIFKSGIQNLYGNEIIAGDAAQDSLGFATQDGKLKLVGGRLLLGVDTGTTGTIRGLWYGYKVDGTLVLYRKTETKLQYWDGSAWQDILTGLTSGTEASFANYSSLAGAFTFFVTVDGFWKINNNFPLNAINMYDASLNFHGRILIDKGRTILWDRNDSGNRDRTGLYGSKIDPQGTNYTSATNEVEATGDGATKAYSGFLQYKSLSPLSNAFGITVTAPTAVAVNITNVTNAVNPTITAASHGLVLGDTVLVAGLTSPATGTGTLDATTNYNITGTGTSFTTQIKVGNRLFLSSGFVVTVQQIIDDTHIVGKYPIDTSHIVAATFTYSNMSQLDNVPLKVLSVPDANNVIVGIDSTYFDLYSSGGTITKAEVLVDDNLGHLAGIGGGTGTINYMTGAYTFNFVNNVANSQSVLVSYQYENSNNGGITDFRQSATRVAGEGFILPQDKGGDPIMNVLIGQDGAYYSLKQQRAYRFVMDDTDLNPDNEIYYENMGVPSINSGVATQQGIVFLNASNPDKPEMTILEKNLVAATLLPKVIFSAFKFSLYDFSDAYFDTYERYIVISCKVFGAAQNNRILLCNLSDDTVDVSPYEARMFAKDDVANFYVGSPLQENTYQIFNGFDDLGESINNYWIGAAQQYAGLKSRQARWRFIREQLKKFRKLYVKGTMSLDQVVEVYISYDDAPFQLVGTIIGRGTYVDSGSGEAIGSNFIGNVQIGGDQIINVYPYFCEIKLKKMPKFRKRTVKLVATGIGYFDVAFMSDFDIMLFENRLPARYRSKQSVSLDGTETDLPDSSFD